MVPGPLRIEGAMSSLVIEAVKRLSRNPASPPEKKLYLSRKKWGARQKFLNRAEIEALAVDFGYEIVYPEELKISDRALIFSQAAVLAGEYGSGMHNSIFAPASCRVLVFQSGAMSHFIQAGLSQAIGQPVGFVFGPADSDDFRTFSISPLHARQAFKSLEG
jgi:capsular polysaccharide biosynthesis protein